MVEHLILQIHTQLILLLGELILQEHEIRFCHPRVSPWWHPTNRSGWLLKGRNISGLAFLRLHTRRVSSLNKVTERLVLLVVVVVVRS